MTWQILKPHWLIILIIIFLVENSWSTAPIVKDDEVFTIVRSTQKLTFFVKNGVLQAKLEAEEVVKCNTKTGEIFRKFLFFDSNSFYDEILINGKSSKPIITDELPSDGIFHNDSKLAYIQFTFGSKEKLLTIQYEKVFENYKLLDLFQFQNFSYSVGTSQISVEVPEWLTCDIEAFNFDNKNITKTVENKKNEKVYTYTYEGIAPKSKVVSKPDYRKYEPHIMLLPKRMKDKNATIELLPNLDYLYKWYHALSQEIGNDNTVLKAKVNELTNGLVTDEDKIKAIFYYIQDNVKYIAFEYGIMGFKPEACQKVFSDKFGDCKGMANLAKEMLNVAGFDARLTWLGTYGIPYNYDFPSVYVDNHMICTVVQDGNYIFLDPTEKYSDMYNYAHRIQGREVMIEDGDTYIRTSIPVQGEKLHHTAHTLDIVLEGSKLLGDGNYVFKGNTKKDFTNFMSSAGSKNQKLAVAYFVANNDNNLTVRSDQKDLLPARDSDFTLEYSIIADNQVMDFDQEKYINLEFDRPLSNIKIEENRDCAYDIGRNYFEDTSTSLTIPPNFAIKYMPTSIVEENEIGKFNFGYQVENNKVIYKKSIQLKLAEIPVNQFETWKNFVMKLNEFYDDRIILEKKQ